MRISDWSSDVCSSDLIGKEQVDPLAALERLQRRRSIVHRDHAIAERLQLPIDIRADEIIVLDKQDQFVATLLLPITAAAGHFSRCRLAAWQVDLDVRALPDLGIDFHMAA